MIQFNSKNMIHETQQYAQIYYFILFSRDKFDTMFAIARRLGLLSSPRFLFGSTLQSEPILTTAQIIDKKPINHDSYIFKFKFSERPFRLGIGQHFRIIERIKTYQCSEGEEVVRKYTPINPCDQVDVLDVLIKIYRPNTNISFPNGGKLTPYLQSLHVGDKIHVEGPLGKFGYEQGGNVIIDGVKKQYKRIFFMAGGTGITPCYQVIREIAKMPSQNIDLVLLFANKTEKDIVLRQELEALASRVKLHFILDSPPANWIGYKGYVSENILKEICPLNDPQTLYIHCGPFAMNSLIKELFKKNYPSSKLFKF